MEKCCAAPQVAPLEKTSRASGVVCVLRETAVLGGDGGWWFLPKGVKAPPERTLGFVTSPRGGCHHPDCTEEGQPGAGERPGLSQGSAAEPGPESPPSAPWLVAVVQLPGRLSVVSSAGTGSSCVHRWDSEAPGDFFYLLVHWRKGPALQA